MNFAYFTKTKRKKKISKFKNSFKTKSQKRHKGLKRTMEKYTKNNKQNDSFKHDNKIYIFAHGSLINDLSREYSLRYKTNGIPVILDKSAGFKRTWVCSPKKTKLKTSDMSFSYKHLCYADLKPSNIRHTNINGVLFEATQKDIVILDKREKFYERIKIPVKYFKPYNNSFDDLVITDDDIIYTYVSGRKNTLYSTKSIMNSDKVILQSYLDVIISGCLKYNREFADMFVYSTRDWISIHNDRVEKVYKRGTNSHKHDEKSINNILMRRNKSSRNQIDEILSYNRKPYDI